MISRFSLTLRAVLAFVAAVLAAAPGSSFANEKLTELRVGY